MISCSPASANLLRGPFSSSPRKRAARTLECPLKPGDDTKTTGGAGTEDKEQAGREGAGPSTGGRPRDTGTCSSVRTDARSCSIRTLPGVPPALATPVGGTRRPSAPSGTSLRNATHLNSRSCFVLNRVELRVKVRGPLAISRKLSIPSRTAEVQDVPLLP